jgi:anti-sigma factor RsiW
MNCEEIMELMQRYIDDDLMEAEQQSLFEHLQDCPDCAASFEQLQILSAELSSLTKVTPPFSIVDSIMPRLAEIDAEAAGIEAAYLSPKHRMPNRFFSWKVATGFAAAAVILSVFAVSLTPASKYDASDKMNQTMGVSNSKPSTKGSVSGAADTPNAEPAAKAESTGKADATDKAGTASEGPAIVFNQQIDESSKTKGTTGFTVQSPTPLPNKSSAADSSKSLKKEANPAEGTAPTKDSSPKATAAPNTSNHMNRMIVPEHAASPGPTPAAAPNPSGGAYSSKNKQNSTFAANSPSTDQLKSDDGQFIGSIENQTVSITTPDMNRVYTSLIQWKPTDTILLLRWLDNTKLSYQVNMEDGLIKHYIIDTIQKTEQEQ